MNETITIDGKEYEVLTLDRIGEITHAKTGSGAILTARSVDGFHHVYSECESWDAVTTFCDEEFAIFGIQPLKLVERKPVEFVATFALTGGFWTRVTCLDDGIAYKNYEQKKFRCVEVVEEA